MRLVVEHGLDGAARILRALADELEGLMPPPRGIGGGIDRSALRKRRKFPKDSNAFDSDPSLHTASESLPQSAQSAARGRTK